MPIRIQLPSTASHAILTGVILGHCYIISTALKGINKNWVHRGGATFGLLELFNGLLLINSIGFLRHINEQLTVILTN